MSSWKWMAAVVVGGCVGSCGLFGQDGSSAQTAPSQQSPVPKPDAAGEPAPQGNGKVLFSRSDDDSTVAKPESAVHPQAVDTTGLQATLQERDSLTFLAYDLDVRLTPRQESLTVRAQITVRNDGEQPLTRIALQLSSTLKWERIKSAGFRCEVRAASRRQRRRPYRGGQRGGGDAAAAAGSERRAEAGGFL